MQNLKYLFGAAAILLGAGCGKDEPAKPHSRIAEFRFCSSPASDGHCQPVMNEQYSLIKTETLNVERFEEIASGSDEIYVTHKILDLDPDFKAIEFRVLDGDNKEIGLSKPVAVEVGKISSEKVALSSKIVSGEAYFLLVKYVSRSGYFQDSFHLTVK